MRAMSEDELFALFERDAEVDVSWRRMPHWDQIGKTYFITFRTFDSLPRAVLEPWLTARDDWLRRHGMDPALWDGCQEFALLPPLARQEFHATFSAYFHRLLDQCHGACVLKRPELARIVGDSLLHFDGVRYHMGDFIVMPNHVHLLVQFLPPTTRKEQCNSWKRFTAVKLQRALVLGGHFWQGESFDHLVRSPEQFEAIRCYIADNPLKANLREGEFLSYVRK
jgi:type I restriction enzyme R subunit